MRASVRALASNAPAPARRDRDGLASVVRHPYPAQLPSFFLRMYVVVTGRARRGRVRHSAAVRGKGDAKGTGVHNRDHWPLQARRKALQRRELGPSTHSTHTASSARANTALARADERIVVREAARRQRRRRPAQSGMRGRGLWWGRPQAPAGDPVGMAAGLEAKQLTNKNLIRDIYNIIKKMHIFQILCETTSRT